MFIFVHDLGLSTHSHLSYHFEPVAGTVSWWGEQDAHFMYLRGNNKKEGLGLNIFFQGLLKRPNFLPQTPPSNSVLASTHMAIGNIYLPNHNAYFEELLCT